MSLTDITPGELSFAVGSTEVAATRMLADEAAVALRACGRSYAFHYCVPDDLRPVFDRRLLKRAGKRHFERYQAESTFDTVQRLIHADPWLHASLRQSVLNDLLELTKTDRSLSLDDIDALVAVDPQAPLATAYTAALASLGYTHPYLHLDRARFAPSVQAVFVAAYAHLPSVIRDWFESHRRHGVHIRASTKNNDKISDRPSFQHDDVANWTTHTTPASALGSVLHHCQATNTDTIVIDSYHYCQRVELQCILRGVPYRISNSMSVLNSPAIRGLVAFLDWAAAQSEHGASMLLSLTGTNLEAWERFARRQNWKPNVATCCFLAAADSDLNGPLVDNLVAVSVLLREGQVDRTLPELLSAYREWGSDYVPHFDLALLKTVEEEISRSPASVTLPLLKEAFYRAMASHYRSAPRLCHPSELAATDARRACLFLSSEEDHQSVIDNVRPHIADRLSVTQLIMDQRNAD